MSTIFLSYSRADIAAMQAIRDYLAEQGLAVWTDEDLEPGTENWTREIESAMFNARAVVVLLSPDAKASTWVGRELALAESYNMRIFPLLLHGDEASAVPFRLIEHQRIDATDNWEAGLAGLAVAVQNFLSLEMTGNPTPRKFGPRPTPPEPAEIFTVSRLGKAHFRSIGEALAVANEGARIVVQPGRYDEQMLVIEQGVEIIGDGLREEIIITGRNNILMIKTDYALIKGLSLRVRTGDVAFAIRLTTGQAMIEDCDIQSDWGGIHIENAACDPIVRGCHIHNSKVGVDFSRSGLGRIEGCQIAHNETGLTLSDHAHPLIINTDFHANDIGASFFTHGRGQVTNCTVKDGRVGVYIAYDSNPTLDRCKITGNQIGLAAMSNGRGTVSNCDLRGNHKTAIQIDESSHVTQHNNQL